MKTCRHDGCRRDAMPDWAYCREHARDVILGRCRPTEYPPYEPGR